MKSITNITIGLMGFLFIAIGCNTNKDAELSPEGDFIGKYHGTFYSCSKDDCTIVPADFEIIEIEAKTFFIFDTIQEQIQFDFNSNTILSALPTWDSSGTTAKYGLSGSFEKDKVKIILSSLFLKEGVYQNELLGTKQH